MAARLQGHVQGGAPGTLARLVEGHDLRMGLSGCLGVPFPHHLAVPDQHGSNGGIGTGGAQGLSRQGQGTAHVVHG